MNYITVFDRILAPAPLKEEVCKALSYYPELQGLQIEFRMKSEIRKSTMQAQPDWKSFFRDKKNRRYLVYISRKFQIEDLEFRTLDIPSDILIGWLGHELGHVVDYTRRNSLNLVWFGIRYLTYGPFIRQAERTADSIAVAHGMHKYILRTKDFILNNADILPAYKDRIRKYYLSPEEIMVLVEERHRAQNAF